MPFAHRFTTNGLSNIDLILEREIETLLAKHKHGIVVRLHVLGDFYSVDYVNFWIEMLEKHPKLCIFGYTGREPQTDIGKAINKMNGERCVIRQSRNFAYGDDNDWAFAAEESFEGNCFDCPEQIGKVKDCASCGLCWTTNKTVRFLTH